MTTRVDGINITDGVITEAKLQTSLNPSGTIAVSYTHLTLPTTD